MEKAVDLGSEALTRSPSMKLAVLDLANVAKAMKAVGKYGIPTEAARPLR